MRVPVKMVENKAYSHKSPNTVHKLGAVVTSMQESSFYPLDVLSEDGKTLLRTLKKNPERKLKNQLNVLRTQVLKDDLFSTLIDWSQFKPVNR